MTGMDSTQGLDQAREIAALRTEVERLRIAHARAEGALADAETVPTGDLERGIRALTATCTAERTRSTLAMAGWKEMERQLLATEADVRALAEALEKSAIGRHELHTATNAMGAQSAFPECSSGACVAARAALARPGVVRVREE